MDEVPEARVLADDTIGAMVDAVAPGRDIVDTRRVDRGFCTVYRVAVDGKGSQETLYLKASPDGDTYGIPMEARLQAILHANTSVPVAPVLGAVDEDSQLPTPYYLMRGLPGAELPYERVARLQDDVLARLARDLGRHLADLHDLPAVEQFGHVRHDGPILTGEKPSGDPAALTVGEPRDSWPAFLRAYANRELDRHEDSQFGSLTDELEPWVDRKIEALDGPFDPVLGRNDHGLHNLLIDPETGAVTGMLDWGYTLAVPATFDVEFAIYLFSGAFLAGLPDVRDRREFVRENLLSGYRSRASDRAAAIVTSEPLYELLAVVRVMNDFGHLTLPEGTEDTVRDRIEADAHALVEGMD